MGGVKMRTREEIEKEETKAGKGGSGGRRGKQQFRNNNGKEMFKKTLRENAAGCMCFKIGE